MQLTSSSPAPESMLGFRLHGAQDLRPARLVRPVPAPGEALLRIRRAGICGSDIHYFVHGRVGSFVPKRPLVLGHEVAAEVVAVGGAEAGGLLGRRVAVDPSMPCGMCRACRGGRYNLCRNMRFLGSASCDPHIDGAFAEYLAIPATNCHPVPDDLSWQDAALAEPLSVAVHALRRAGEIGGRSVLVTGAGAIGLLIAMAARAFGAAIVAVSDPWPGRRAAALGAGADHVLDAASPDFVGEAEEASGGGFDVALEAAGAAQALGQGIAAVRRGGTVVQVGTLPAEVTLPLNDVMAREIALLGSFRFANVFPIALNLLARRRVEAHRLVSAVYPFASTPQAFARAAAGGDVVKVQVEA